MPKANADRTPITRRMAEPDVKGPAVTRRPWTTPRCHFAVASDRTVEVIMRDVRNRALEEAAWTCELIASMSLGEAADCADHCARSIRMLKDRP